MVSALWLVLALAAWGLVHSLLASLGAKALARRLFGPGVERVYRLAYNAFAAFSLLPIGWLLLVLPDWPIYALPMPWAYSFRLVQLLALVALGIGLLQTGALSFLGLSQIWRPEPAASGLMTAGLYRFVRHPLYSAGLALLWFSPSMTADRLALTTAATFYLLIGAWFEERKLRREFGEAYARYASVTPMLIPFTRRNKFSA